MRCKSFWKKIISFSLAFLLGLFVVGISRTIFSFNKVQELMSKENNAMKVQDKSVYKNIYTEQGWGSAACGGVKRDKGIGTGSGFSGSANRNEKSSTDFSDKRESLRITFKPKPKYTEEAKRNNIEGSVTVRVTFLASGEIGEVTLVSGLSCGLTEQAILAAKQMRFKPQIKNGSPQTVIRPVRFNFTIY